MKIVVLAGSPKGEKSVTVQYVKYLARHFSTHSFEIIHVAHLIKKLEKDTDAFDEIRKKVEAADGVIWAFPLYFCTVASQYQRFIELVFERNAQNTFKDKYTCSITTSIHFFDHTAHNYIHSICDDLDMIYINAYPAGMDDMLSAKGRENVVKFGEEFFWSIENRIKVNKKYNPINGTIKEFKSVTNDLTGINTAKKAVIVCDSEEGNIGEMIKEFRQNFTEDVPIVNLSKMNIKGGCMGCLRCGPDNICAYAGKDDYIDTYNSQIKTADIIIFAFGVKYRYLSSLWKLYLDRSFFNTHQRSIEGKQIGFLISGPYSQLEVLKEVIHAYVEFQSSYLVDVITDEDNSDIPQRIKNLAQRLVFNSDSGYIRPLSFLHVGGMKIFRDDVFSQLKVIFRADHKYYKRKGIYDFPQNKIGKMLMMNIMYLITVIPAVRKGMINKIRDFMIKPYEKFLNDAGTKQ